MKKVLITGATSGIGEALARSFHARGVKVIASGRDRKKLDILSSREQGIETCVMDVSDYGSVIDRAKEIEKHHPDIDTVINNAGVQRLIDFRSAGTLERTVLDEEIDINLKGLIYVSATFLPLLLRQPSSRLVQISSGLALVPLIKAPIYSATKAAVHSFSISLRAQLKGSPVKLIEILPPLVETNLHRGQGNERQGAMKLDAFTEQVLTALDSEKTEIPIGLAKALRIGSRIAPALFQKIINKR